MGLYVNNFSVFNINRFEGYHYGEHLSVCDNF